MYRGRGRDREFVGWHKKTKGEIQRGKLIGCSFEEDQGQPIRSKGQSSIL